MPRDRRRALILMLALALGPIPAAGADDPLLPAPAVEPTDAEALLREAQELRYRKKDYTGALRLFNAAVAAAPDDPQILLERAEFLTFVSGIVIEKDREGFREAATADYRHVASLDPDSIAAGIARDAIARLEGRELFPERTADCPEKANEAYHRAESQFHRGDYELAADQYEIATTLCPASAAAWVSRADAHYMLEQYERAAELFRRGLESDPWHRQGHRFLSDALAKRGDLDGALREAELAVVADPTYEAAWGTLRSLAGHAGRDWRRVWGDKPSVTRKPPKAVKKGKKKRGGKTEIEIALPAYAEQTGDETDPDAMAWIGYAMSKALVLGGDEAKPPVDPETLSALEIERRSVLGGLVMVREAGEGGEMASEFWSMLDRAERAGFLDEAIFLHLMDATLAGEYTAFREQSSGRLVDYLETFIVPVRTEEPSP